MKLPVFCVFPAMGVTLVQRLVCLLAALSGVWVASPARAAEPPPFTWRDGDRVVLIGDALIEREQKYGYLETLITLQNPDKTITFRNLGWSGDTVHGVARAGFGKPEEGYRHLVEHVLALKPTVIIVGYGMTDSFAGVDGQKSFAAGLRVLLDVLAQTEAQILLLSPIRHESLGRPLPEPLSHNLDLAFYSLEIAKIAGERRLRFIDLFSIDETAKPGEFEPKTPRPRPLTDDGIHLDEFGYWKLASVIVEKLGCGNGGWHLEISPTCRPSMQVSGTAVKWVRRTGPELCVECTDWTLPTPPSPAGPANKPGAMGRTFWVDELATGRYVLRIDGKIVATAEAMEREKRGFEALALMIDLVNVPEIEQVERLRQAIIAKNLLYFYRWRPQNETYLFGFRKHEQGNNAREIPLFDPLVEEKEKEIERLKVPVKHVYELIRVGEGEK